MKYILLLTITLFSFRTFSAEQYEKNGYPCMSNICLGDDLESLKKIKWEPAKNLKPIEKMRRDDLERLYKAYKGKEEDLNRALPYIKRNFDNVGLDLMKKVKAACTINAVSGKFVTENGNKTHVVVMLMGPPGKQKWTVSMIKREFDGVETNAQRLEIKNSLMKRYSKFDPATAAQAKVKPKGIMMLIPIGKLSVQFNLIQGLSSIDELKSDPLCGGNKKISID